MAELNTSCCSTDTQANCCQRAEKAACCGQEGGEACGCAPTTDATPNDIREAVRAKYAQYAVAAPDREGAFGAALYSRGGRVWDSRGSLTWLRSSDRGG